MICEFDEPQTFARWDRLRELAPELTPVDASEYITFDPPPHDPFIEGVCDHGDKILLVAKSKQRKSFFALWVSLHLAAGRDVWGLKVPKPVKVLLVNLELTPDNFHRRVNRVAKACGITPNALAGRLLIIHGRGHGMTLAKIREVVDGERPELVVLDPCYKVFTGAENDDTAWRDFLAEIDAICLVCKSSMLMVHHDKKGASGDTDHVDRGSGHSTLGRDYDVSITMTPHVTEAATVFNFICRNYVSPDPVVATYENGDFVLADLLPEVETGGTKARKASRGPAIEDLAARALPLLTEETARGKILGRICTVLKVGKPKARDVLVYLIDCGAVGEGQSKGFPTQPIVHPTGKGVPL